MSSSRNCNYTYSHAQVSGLKSVTSAFSVFVVLSNRP